MKILVINGPNLNMLGIREPEIYGEKTLEDLIDYVIDYCKPRNVEVEFYQSNHDGVTASTKDTLSVKTGRFSTDYVEVTEGLKENEQVMLDRPAA